MVVVLGGVGPRHVPRAAAALRRAGFRAARPRRRRAVRAHAAPLPPGERE